MAVYNLEQYRALQKRRLEALQKNSKRGEILSAQKYATRLRMTAPAKTGKLIRSIVRRKNMVSIGRGNKGFPYIHWINQTSPQFVTINMKRSKRTGKFVKKQTPDKYAHKISATYGFSPNWNWTARAGFVRIAQMETRNDWSVLISKINKKSLKGELI